ncbi:MAG: hypothetical protein DPW18_09185 [Chloroflexi bacterium]|nr:hypothetical protein [Chloroflexota bacterium]MDL1941613.1 GAF domain-containing protein [Chloroflexi bacterium CFX2]
MEMSSSRNPGTGLPAERYARNARVITLALMIMTVPTAALFAYFGYINGFAQLYIPAALLIATAVVDILPLALIKRGRSDLAMMIVITMFMANVLIVPFIVKGLGPVIAASIMLVVLSAAGLAMTPKYSVAGVMAALLVGASTIALDIVLGGNRIEVSQLAVVTPYIVFGIALPIFLVLIREFRNFSLQIKITLGILLAGSGIVVSMIFFGLNSANAILGSITAKYETSVTNQIETQIFDTVQVEADNANALFEEVTRDLVTISLYRRDIDSQRFDLASGQYWNAAEKLVQLPGGQYGNSGVDTASVYIPNTYPVTEEMLADLNTTIYLDFLATSYLEAHPEVAAVYYISRMGYTVYYPNINLAQNIEPDFDPTQQPFFTIATPDQNPERLPRWTKPYQDPAGAGMIVTLSIPVYSNNGAFLGVLGADIKLASIAERIANIQISPSSIAFLVDKNGIVLVMPEAGYQLFGLQPEDVPVNENPKLSVLSADSEIGLFIAQRIVISRSNLITVPIQGVRTYLAIASLEATEYKLVILAPVNELNQEILASRSEIQNEVAGFLRSASVILVLLIMGSLAVSLLIGQFITRPLKQLTNTVEEIAGGNLAARVKIESQDETGLLARSFNSMADKLNETLYGLEEKVAERTRELERINASNAYRARQFEAIARIASTISSTQSLDRLLPQITETISEQLGFYHVGIFLLDVHKENAVLAAANSEGGRRMLARNHRLRVGEVGIVGNVTWSGQPRVALDVGADAVFFDNPDLPNTRSEIALPLLAGTEVIGALDVQSTETNAFSQEDVNILSALADQVSIAIQNARSYQQSRETLEQAELIAAQMSEQQWLQFLARQDIHGYHFDGVNAVRLDMGNEKPSHGIAIPLILRGTQIGTLKLSASDPNRQWDEDEIALAQATAERTALAIENARLLQEAQKRAAKERTIGQISEKIGRLVNLDNILKTTIQELGNTLPGTDIAIQFLSGKPER